MTNEKLEKMLKMKEDDYMDLCGEFDKLEQQNELLRRYITRGGFIQDMNGRWCKEGDKVAFAYCISEDKKDLPEGILNWDENIGQFYILDENCPCEPVNYLNEVYFELATPCEPDICKDFKEADE